MELPLFYLFYRCCANKVSEDNEKERLLSITKEVDEIENVYIGTKDVRKTVTRTRKVMGDIPQYKYVTRTRPKYRSESYYDTEQYTEDVPYQTTEQEQVRVTKTINVPSSGGFSSSSPYYVPAHTKQVDEWVWQPKTVTKYRKENRTRQVRKYRNVPDGKEEYEDKVFSHYERGLVDQEYQDVETVKEPVYEQRKTGKKIHKPIYSDKQANDLASTSSFKKSATAFLLLGLSWFLLSNIPILILNIIRISLRGDEWESSSVIPSISLIFAYITCGFVVLQIILLVLIGFCAAIVKEM